MKTNRARIYDILALLTVIVVIALDQWTKALVVEHLSPPDSGNVVSLIGNYLVLDYIQNRGAAFGMFANTFVLALLIAAAIAVIIYLYLRILNSGPLVLKLILGMIIGGAAGNLIDRIHHGGYVVDFVYFSIPQISFHFAVFNLADASISVGVFLLFVYVLVSGLRGSNNDKKTAEDRKDRESSADGSVKHVPSPASNGSGTLRSGEQDV